MSGRGAVDAPYKNAVQIVASVFDGNDNNAGVGGALTISHNGNIVAVAELRDCVFSRNNAGSGGAISTTKQVVMQGLNLTFDGNTADTGDPRAANAPKRARVPSSDSCSNPAAPWCVCTGGAVALFETSSAMITSSTFVRNSARAEGGALAFAGTGTAYCRMKETVLTENTAGAGWSCS